MDGTPAKPGLPRRPGFFFSDLRAQVARVLKNWSVVPDSVQRASGGFSTASVYCVTEPDGRRFALRRTPIGGSSGHTPRQVVFELLSELRASGFPQIAAPIARVPRVGRLPSAAPASHSWEVVEGGAVWHLEPWFPGCPVTGAQITAAMLRDAILRIRLVHDHAAKWAARVCPASLPVARGRSLAVQRRLQIVESLHDGELAFLRQKLDRLDTRERAGAAELLCVIEGRLPEVRQCLERAAAMNVCRQPIVGDLWRAHVLFEAGQVSGLIDFWNCRSDHPWVDFARLFRSWFAADNLRVREAWESCLQGSWVTADERNLLSGLDECTVLLSPLTWLRRFLQDPKDDGPPSGCCERFLELTATAAGYQPVRDWC